MASHGDPTSNRSDTALYAVGGLGAIAALGAGAYYYTRKGADMVFASVNIPTAMTESGSKTATVTIRNSGSKNGTATLDMRAEIKSTGFDSGWQKVGQKPVASGQTAPFKFPISVGNLSGASLPFDLTIHLRVHTGGSKATVTGNRTNTVIVNKSGSAGTKPPSGSGTKPPSSGGSSSKPAQISITGVSVSKS